MTEVPQIRDRHYLRWIWAYAKPYRRWLGVGLVLLILQVISTNAFPLIIKKAIDSFLLRDAEPLGEQARLQGLQELCMWLFALAGGMFVFRISHAYLMTWVGQQVLRDLRVTVFRKVLSLPMRRIDQLQVGRLMTRATSDLDALQELIRNGLIGLLANLLLLVGAMVFIWILEAVLRKHSAGYLPCGCSTSVSPCVNGCTRRAMRYVTPGRRWRIGARGISRFWKSPGHWPRWCWFCPAECGRRNKWAVWWRFCITSGIFSDHWRNWPSNPSNCREGWHRRNVYLISSTKRKCPRIRKRP
jgi:hypothetical protein